MQQEQIDENLYSRQIAVLGAETQAKLLKMKVFIHGLRGLGVETAKNLILAGPKSVTISDRTLVELTDLGSNFYLTHDHIGKTTREEACLPHLKELNPYVTVEAFQGDITPEALSDFTVVVLTDTWDLKFITAVNEAVRAKNNGFIFAHSSGLFGSVFVDFSDKFTVFDATGEEVKQAIIAGISNDEHGLVNTTEDKRHGFQDGDWVTFKEVLGMTEVNDKIFQINVKTPYMFSIGDTSAFSPYQREGLAVQVKKPTELNFKSFKASLTHPYAPNKNELDLMDWEKIGKPEQLHLVLNALLHYYEKHNHLPRINSDVDSQLLWNHAKEINESDRGEGAIKTELDEKFVRQIAEGARAQITPMTSFWGGIVAQEIVKHTGKFTPIRQWLHSEFLEALPEGENVDRHLHRHTQYDDYISIFGNEALKQLQDSRAFMVGAGALGCEFIKMFALMGMGSGPRGQVTVTDDDNIEISNLNRQFLFRKKDVASNKAATACAVGRRMNRDSKLVDKALRVGKQNEHVFDDAFWEGLDMAINAVDNIHARRYIDDQCCYYSKPLFESGTLGTKCNSQLIIPFKTQSYSETQDPPEESIPLCTLKNFPYQIDHTIQWARDYFQGVFADGSIECIKYLENPSQYIKRATLELKGQPGVLRPRLETIKKYVDIARKPDTQQLVSLARNLFQDIFCNQIKQLLYCFPPDHRTTEGHLFWTNPKRPPVAIEFDISDPTHMLFIKSAVNIFSDIFGLPRVEQDEALLAMLKGVAVEEYVPKNVQLKENDKDTKEEKSEDDEEQIKRLSDELEKLQISDKQPVLKECAFEKDDPTNWHIEFLSAVANLRARNYKIAEVSAFQVKLIAGKIIPALATTTAMIVGAVGLEIFKYILKKDVSKMRNAFINLALPLFLFSEPLPPGQHLDQEYSQVLLGPTKGVPQKWTAWDRITVRKQMKLREFIEHFKKEYDVVLTSITVDKYILFSSYPAPTQEDLDRDLGALYVHRTGQELPHHRKYLDLTIGGDIMENGMEKNADVAPVKYQYKQ